MPFLSLVTEWPKRNSAQHKQKRWSEALNRKTETKQAANGIRTTVMWVQCKTAKTSGQLDRIFIGKYYKEKTSEEKEKQKNEVEVEKVCIRMETAAPSPLKKVSIRIER